MVTYVVCLVLEIFEAPPPHLPPAQLDNTYSNTMGGILHTYSVGQYTGSILAGSILVVYW